MSAQGGSTVLHAYMGLVDKSDSNSEQRYYLQSMLSPHEYTMHRSLREVDSGKPMVPLIPWIESAKVVSKSLAYLIRPGSDFWGHPELQSGTLYIAYGRYTDNKLHLLATSFL